MPPAPVVTGHGRHPSIVDKTCRESTDSLNCGCCESLQLSCDRKVNHRSAHETTIESWRTTTGDRIKRYRVSWLEVTENDDAEGSPAVRG